MSRAHSAAQEEEAMNHPIKGFGWRKDLKPCPLCGSWDVELLPSTLPPMPPELLKSNKLKALLVRCSQCGCNVKTFSRFRRCAVDNWNSRREAREDEIPPGHPRRKD